MKQKYLTMLLSVLMSMVGAKTFAYDIEVKNADGVTIYYNLINDGTELAVTYYGFSVYYKGNVVIPESVTYNGKTRNVTSIGDEAFYWCTGLTELTIPNSVTSIGNSAFFGCYGLKKVIVKDLAAWCGIFFSHYSSNPLYYAEHLYSDDDTEITDLVIPASVTSIGNYAFSGCFGLTEVTIPNSVTYIGDEAFSGCIGLTELTIGNSVTSIGDSAFSGCYGLTELTIGNSVTSIGEGAFCRCDGLTEVTIPNSVIYIGDEAFFGCYGLTEVTIGNSVTSIGDRAFYKCEGLTELTIPNSVTSIGNYAFYWCSGLTELTIPNSVTSIGNAAFAHCYGLTELTIPNSVTSIGEDAFAHCYGLTELTIGNSVTSIGEDAFCWCEGLTSITSLNTTPPNVGGYFAFESVTYRNVPLHVPAGCTSAYRQAKHWEYFYTIIDDAPTGIESIRVDKQDKTTIYTLDGKQLHTTNAADLPKGIYIINGKKVAVK